METSPKPAAWTTYLAALTAASRLEDPSDEAMAAICPHLTPQAAVAAFRTGGDGHSSRVACPPLRAEELVHVFRYRKPHDGMPGRLEHERVERADILCAGCGHTFDDQETSPDSSCLGERLANLAVAAGISFQKDPAIARAAERARWEATLQGRRK